MKTAIRYISPANQIDRVLRLFVAAIICFALIFPPGCATVGHDFPVAQVNKIQIGKTTKADIRAMFGNPWRVGLEDGQETWSYGQYRYTMFSEKDAKDLVVRFTDNDIVQSYTFNTTSDSF
jgi:outer membrane protein assembly factor BamE (lipoprotein component of BamABCDE complex)